MWIRLEWAQTFRLEAGRKKEGLEISETVGFWNITEGIN